MALAVKGFAVQNFRRPLLSAMGLWADLLLRTGNLSSAETILQFLKQEYERGTGMELDGQVPYALGRAEWLLCGSSGAKALLLEAFDAFVRDGSAEQADMAVELFMLEGREQDTALETALVMHVQKLAAANERFKPYDLLLQALRLAKQEEWEAAAGILMGIPLEHLPYKLAAAAELQLIYALRLSNNRAYLQQLARLDRLKISYVSDWELQYSVRLALADGYQAQGNHKAAEQAFQEMDAIGGMLKFSYMKREREEQREQPSLEKPAEGPSIVISEEASPAAGGPLTIHCFGGLRLIGRQGEAADIPWKRKKAKELFIYLLLEPNYSAGKEEIAELLLPGNEPERALKHLSVIVHQLRKVLQSALQIDNGVLIKDDRFG